MKNIISILSIISLGFIIAFFSIQTFIIKNNAIMSGKMQTIFGVGFLIISVCIFTFLIIAMLGKINIPASVEVVIFEIFLAAVALGVVSFFLIFKK